MTINQHYGIMNVCCLIIEMYIFTSEGLQENILDQSGLDEKKQQLQIPAINDTL